MLGAFFFFSSDFFIYFQVMLQSGLLKPFSQLLRHHEPVIVREAAATLSHITAGTRDQIQMIIGKGLKPKNFGVQGGLVIRPYS